MIIKTIVDEDFSNYKKPSMLIGFPLCTFKCEKEYGEQVCQNSALATSKDIYVYTYDIVFRYLDNSLTSAIVCGGLEPFDSFDDLKELVCLFRKHTNDDIVIYTGYYENEIIQETTILKKFPNIIIKFGRYIPHQDKHYDEVLGVNLASNNQYAKKIS